MASVWHGDCLDANDVALAMGGRTVDALIFDAPYSKKTHDGHAAGKLTADRAAEWAANAKEKTRNTKNEIAYAARKSAAGDSGRRDLDYESFDSEKIDRFCSIWLPRCSGWVVSITDDALAPVWSEAFASSGLYVFSPLPLVETGSRVRMTGDGPSNWTCWVVVARPRSEPYSKWGTLPGAYVQPGERAQNSKLGTDRIVGGKPLRSMMKIVSDYSKSGDIICDPFLGHATTMIAALRTGRAALGIESDPVRALESAEIVSAEERYSTRRAEISGQGSLFK